MDKLNEKIIEQIANNARQSGDVVAKKLDVSPATVRRRLNQLIDSKTIRIVPVIDPIKFGYPLTVIIAFDVKHNKMGSATQLLGSKSYKF